MKKHSVTAGQQEKWKDLTTYDAYETGSVTRWPGIGKLRLSHREDSSMPHTPLTMQVWSVNSWIDLIPLTELS